MSAVWTIHICALLTATFGAVAFCGWWLDVSTLKSILPGAVEMKANAAIGLVLAAATLFGTVKATPSRKSVSVVLSLLPVIVGLLGLATLAEYLTGSQLGIDELLFRDTANAYNVIPGRMSPYTAGAFVATGSGLAVCRLPQLRKLAALCAIVTLGIGAFALLGYLWNASELITDRWVPPVAVNTAVALVLLGSGTLLTISQRAKQQSHRPLSFVSIEGRVLTGFFATLAILVLSGGVSYRAMVHSADSAQRVTHTNDVRLALGKLYGDIADAETAQRTYLITGNRSQLSKTRQLISNAMGSHQALSAMVIDNPVQSEHVAKLDVLIQRTAQILERGIALYQQEGFNQAKELVQGGEGVAAMDALAAQIRDMDDREMKLLAERGAAFVEARQRTLTSLLVTLLISAVGFAVLFNSVRNAMAARHAVERALVKAREDADSANRAKSTFLATMSHEIRTPMNGVLGMLELLTLSKLEAAQRTTVQIVHESAQSLLRIIDDILDFSKIEAGRLHVQPEVTSVKDVIEGVHNIYSGNASSKGIAIKRSADPRISPALLVDGLRLRQILNNFVSNALKFTSRGHIEVKADLVERLDGMEQIRFSVRDTGIGISEENQKHLFQPFSQADDDTARRFGGTGLGLTICKRLAHLMGGSIDIHSELDKGTTMSLTLLLPIGDAKNLPSTEAERMQQLLDAPSPPRRNLPTVAQAESEGTLVLVVDDHPTNRMVLINQLNSLGYAAEYAENGLEALEKWKSAKFAMVITDCNMPEMDGYELARSIRSSELATTAERTPILACTANALAGEATKCFAAGMDDYISKPVQLPKLLVKLDQWLPIPSQGIVCAASTDSPSTAPIDHTVLSEVSGGRRDSERDILASFRHANDADAAKLMRAAAEGQLAEIARAAHRIKGASSSIGAGPLAAICEDIEHATRTENWATISQTMLAFSHELALLNNYVDTLGEGAVVVSPTLSLAQHATLSRPTFLVVEDHDFQRDMLVKVIDGLGAARVLATADGVEALKIIEDPSSHIDIVVSDLDMPGMDGMEFIRRMAQTQSNASLIVVSALSIKLVSSVRQMATAYGVNVLGAIEKPITQAKLQHLVDQHLVAKSQVASPRAMAPIFTLAEVATGLRQDEFEPFFQPQIEIATGQVKGMEALARWRHPVHGIIAPYAFIRLMEDNGLIDDLTWIMLEKATACSRDWRAQGLDATVSVNLSLKSLSNENLADRIADVVLRLGVDPDNVVLEVTESAAATNVGHTLENLARLRMKGFGLSIDDYGTGYSSIQRLAGVAFTELKIEQSFVTNAASHESSRVILESSLDMAKKLQMTSVAEGVETQADWDLLRQLGCDLAQGYFIAMPMDAQACIDWIRGWKLSK